MLKRSTCDRWAYTQIRSWIPRRFTNAASQHIQRVDAFEIHKRGIRSGELVAPTHIQHVDAFEIHTHSVRDGGLLEVIHLPRVDTPEMHKTRHP